MSKWINLAALPVFAVALSFAGCESAPKDSAAPAAVQSVQPITIISQTQGSDPALTQPMVKLITAQEQLDALGAESLAGVEVDFAEQQVVLVALGSQPSGGYWTQITGIQQLGDTLYVQGIANAPAEGEAVTQALTYPYAAAVIPATSATTALSDIQSVTGQAAE